MIDTLNLFLVLLAGVVNLATAYLVIQLRKVVVAAASDILKVEKATNSMKDALVAATAKASLSEGREQGRIETELRNKEEPLPVADDRTAAAAERSASATERVADAAENPKEKKR